MKLSSCLLSDFVSLLALTSSAVAMPTPGNMTLSERDANTFVMQFTEIFEGDCGGGPGAPVQTLTIGTLGSCHNLNTGYNGFELLERGSNIANDCIRLCEGLGCIGGQILRLSDIPLDECMEATSGPAQSIAFSEPC